MFSSGVPGLLIYFISQHVKELSHFCLSELCSWTESLPHGDAAGSSCRSPWYMRARAVFSGKEVVALFSTYLAGVCPLHHFLPLSKR